MIFSRKFSAIRQFGQASYGAQIANHGFDRIYFFDLRCGVRLIYQLGMPRLEIRHNLEPGYPAMTSYMYAGAPFTTTSSENDKPNTYDYEVEEMYTVVVEPLDQTYRTRGTPARRIKPAKRIRIKAFHSRAEHEIVFD